jgi:hypothetical protein
MTQARASTTFDLPEPFGPTMQVTPGSKTKLVGWANDLKPLSVRLFRCIGAPIVRGDSRPHDTGNTGIEPDPARTARYPGAESTRRRITEMLDGVSQVSLR